MKLSDYKSLQLTNNAWAGFFLLISIVMVLLAYSFINPYWETNDDVAMSMVANGYGLAFGATSNLVFSNVVWGYFVRFVPEINGLLGYSVATISILVAVGSTFLYILWRLGYSIFFSLCLVILLLMRPVWLPQFTVNAGLLTVAFIACLRIHVKTGDQIILFLGCIYAFLGFLIRSQEFFLVLAIGMPLFSWGILKEKLIKKTFLVLIGFIVLAACIDYLAYIDLAWVDYKELNLVRLLLTDYKAGLTLLQEPEILLKYSFSENDINLMSNWFFADPVMANPMKISSMLSEAKGMDKSYKLMDGWIALKALWDFRVAILLAVALSLGITLRGNIKLCIIWILAISAFFTMGFIGRPGYLRVYVPVIILLVLVPLLENNEYFKRKKFILTSMLLICNIVSIYKFYPLMKEYAISNQLIVNEIKNLPSETIVEWGEFPFVAAYPVLLKRENIPPYDLYVLASFQRAPFSLSYIEEASGNGFKQNLFSNQGVLLMATGRRIDLLSTYCKERYNATLYESLVNQYSNFALKRVRCVINN